MNRPVILSEATRLRRSEASASPRRFAQNDTMGLFIGPLE